MMEPDDPNARLGHYGKLLYHKKTVSSTEYSEKIYHFCNLCKDGFCFLCKNPEQKMLRVFHFLKHQLHQQHIADRPACHRQQHLLFPQMQNNDQQDGNGLGDPVAA